MNSRIVKVGCKDNGFDEPIETNPLKLKFPLKSNFGVFLMKECTLEEFKKMYPNVE